MDMQALRKRAGLSRIEVAFRLAISETSVRNWEAGRTPPTMTVQKYLEALRLFKCTPEELANASNKSMLEHQQRQARRSKRVDTNEIGEVASETISSAEKVDA